MSYVSDGSIIRAKTIGIGGFVFGPVPPKRINCPKDYVILAPPTALHELSATVKLDGRMIIDGEEMERDAFLQHLATLPDKEWTHLVLHISLKSTTVSANQLMDDVSALGFQVTMTTEAESDIDSQVREEK